MHQYHGAKEMTMAEREASTYLSKSLYIRGNQCHKSLWLHKHNPELKDAVDETQQTRFDSGHEVGALAQRLFPGGVEVPYEGLSHAEQVSMTRTLVAAGAETIYEATFQHDGVFVKVDILHRGPAGWEILEVKGSAEVKEVHYRDAALQLHVVAGAGLPVAKVAIVHIDNTYVRCGDLEVQKVFAVEDVTKEVREMQANVAAEIAELRAMLAEAMPAIDIGPRCSDPYDCDFHGHCWQHIPEDSVFDLRERGVDKFALYGKGIVHQRDIPLDILNAKQRQQIEATLNRCDSLDKAEVRRFLGELWHPLCYLDFETVFPAIPPFDGLRPYQQMPFQYSLHVQASPGAELQHHEFLAEPGVDPREKLTERLLAQIPDGACIIAWNQSFEMGILGGLAERLPRHAARIGRLLEGFRDPMTLFRARCVYHWQQKGSYSIKAVLPILVPELTYDGLEVADGEMAMGAYRAMGAARDPQELARIRAALLEYCKLDTLAMVRIVERLREMAR
jgi:hypothetical protein